MISKTNLIIGWLYPKQMSTYGDRGNVLTLWRRCRWRGIDVEVKEIEIGQKISPLEADLYFFGGGQDQAQKKISEDLIAVKREALKKAARLGVVFLGICGGYQLLGHFYRPANGDDLPGLGILDVKTVASERRMIGNIVFEINSEINLKEKLIVGFENHSGKTYLGSLAKPLGRVIVGFGNNAEDRTEGAFQNNVFGCYLHGPVLPKNPEFADFLIKRALERKYPGVILPKLDDTKEEEAHFSALLRARKTK